MTNYAKLSSTSITSSSQIHPQIHPNHISISPKSKFPLLLNANYPHNLPNHAQLSLSFNSQSLRPISCCSSLGPGEGDSRTVLDAFFLGKALGEAVTERVESVVGEILSTVGRLQAEQQKQIQDFQEDVLDRAKTAKEKAAREALLAQGRLTPTYTARNADVRITSSDSSVNSAAIVETNVSTSSADEDDEDSSSAIPIDE
ncbi:uncharacterized protein At4g13200, chloroplastic [Silene latifolia]|uniref:uncharacterized protein At4g13200, chloroplastic n=1 Tax=Silene latifolia TaxID=37657 RepID=UPI003D773C1E